MTVKSTSFSNMFIIFIQRWSCAICQRCQNRFRSQLTRKLSPYLVNRIPSVNLSLPTFCQLVSYSTIHMEPVKAIQQFEFGAPVISLHVCGPSLFIGSQKPEIVEWSAPKSVARIL